MRTLFIAFFCTLGFAAAASAEPTAPLPLVKPTAPLAAIVTNPPIPIAAPVPFPLAIPAARLAAEPTIPALPVVTGPDPTKAEPAAAASSGWVPVLPPALPVTDKHDA